MDAYCGRCRDGDPGAASAVPENAIKFAVGTMIAAFGSFWTLEAIGGAAAWPWGDWSLLGLAAFYAMGGLAVMVLLHTRPTARAG